MRPKPKKKNLKREENKIYGQNLLNLFLSLGLGLLQFASLCVRRFYLLFLLNDVLITEMWGSLYIFEIERRLIVGRRMHRSPDYTVYKYIRTQAGKPSIILGPISRLNTIRKFIFVASFPQPLLAINFSNCVNDTSANFCFCFDFFAWICICLL